MERVILHSDLNNFYASVELLKNPELRGFPLAVIGDVENRHGIVLAKDYLAKDKGVMTGDPVWLAHQKYDNLQVVNANFPLYMKYSKLARDLYREYSDKVESFGLDECWLDISNSAKSFKMGKLIADEIRTRMKEEIGLTISIGVSYNKIFAKLGSDMKKPDATTIITPNSFRYKIWNLPVSELLYVGSSTKKKLARYGIFTIGALANSDMALLQQILGVNGLTLWRFANGLDTSPVKNIGSKSPIKTIGNSTTTPRDLFSDNDIKITLYALCESISARLREYDFTCKTIQLSIRDNTLSSISRQMSIGYPSRTVNDIFGTCYRLFYDNWNGIPIRSLGVRATGLDFATANQLSLLPQGITAIKNEDRDTAVDKIRNLYGHKSIFRCIMMTDEKLSALDPKNDHVIFPVSFFR